MKPDQHLFLEELSRHLIKDIAFKYEGATQKHSKEIWELTDEELTQLAIYETLDILMCLYTKKLRQPPDLGINVGEEVGTDEAFGG